MTGRTSEVALAIQHSVVLPHLFIVLHAHPVARWHVWHLPNKHYARHAVAREHATRSPGTTVGAIRLASSTSGGSSRENFLHPSRPRLCHTRADSAACARALLENI